MRKIGIYSPDLPFHCYCYWPYHMTPMTNGLVASQILMKFLAIPHQCIHLAIVQHPAKLNVQGFFTYTFVLNIYQPPKLYWQFDKWNILRIFKHIYYLLYAGLSFWHGSRCCWVVVVAVYISSHITEMDLVTDGWGHLWDSQVFGQRGTGQRDGDCNLMAMSCPTVNIVNICTIQPFILSTVSNSHFCFLQHEWAWGGQRGLNCPYRDDHRGPTGWPELGLTDHQVSTACQLVCPTSNKLQRPPSTASIPSPMLHLTPASLTSSSGGARDGARCQEHSFHQGLDLPAALSSAPRPTWSNASSIPGSPGF